MGNNRKNTLPGRGVTIENCPLFTAGLLVFNKLKKIIRNSMRLKFADKFFMPNFIKLLRDVSKHTSCVYRWNFIKLFLYFMYYAKELWNVRITWKKTRLINCEKVIFNKKLTYWCSYIFSNILANIGVRLRGR